MGFGKDTATNSLGFFFLFVRNAIFRYRGMLPSACYEQVYRCRQRVQASARYSRIVTGCVRCLTPSPSFCRRQVLFSAEVSNVLVLQQTLSLGSTAQHSSIFILSLFLSWAISARPSPSGGNSGSLWVTRAAPKELPARQAQLIWNDAW